MNLLKQVYFLIQKDLLLEWRQKYAFNGILLYVVSTVVVVYLAFMDIEGVTWITLFWIIMLFASVNAVAKSFLQESADRQLYYYTLASPEAIVLSKMIYNVLLLLLLAMLALGVYSILLGYPVENTPLFLSTVILGAVGFALCFTLISAISSKASNNATLMPVLSFPVIIPVLSLLITLSKSAVLGIEGDENAEKDILVLLAIDGIMLVLSFILFPYLWRD